MNTYILRPGRQIIGLLAILALTLFPLAQPQTDVPAEVALGTGWATFAACVGCGVGAIAIVSGGPASIIAALHFPGGGIIAGGCVAACVETVY